MKHQHRLMTTEREQRILALLSQADALSVSELSKSTGASSATLRRDLASMQERGLLYRFHGGATLKPNLASEQLFSDKENLHGAEKIAIATAALQLIEDRDCIYLDGGSTTLLLAKMLDQRHNLTVVTNSLMAAFVLMESGHKLLLTGGEFRALSRTLVGPLSASIIQDISVDKAFMGTMGFTLSEGLSTSDPNEAFTKRLIMKRSRQVVLLADNSKIGVNSFVNTGHLDDVDILVTDQLTDNIRVGLEESGIKVVITSK